jgi:hypothetical protein
MSRESLLKKINQYVLEERYLQIDEDFLIQEVRMASDKDLDRIDGCLYSRQKFDSNPHNSILLYLTGLTDEFDFDKQRSDTIGGAPPD